MSLTRLPGALLGSFLSLSLSFVIGCAKEDSAAPAAASDEAATATASEGTPAATPSQRPLPRLESPTAPTPSARAGEPGSRRRGERGERGGRRGRMMERFDQNGDGQLDDTERAAMTHDRAARMIERNDSDGDGALSKAELEAIEGPGRRFLGADSGADANGDGTLTAAELEARMSERMKERRGGAPEQGAAEAPAQAED